MLRCASLTNPRRHTNGEFCRRIELTRYPVSTGFPAAQQNGRPPLVGTAARFGLSAAYFTKYQSSGVMLSVGLCGK
jgi:hypothetical protein